MVRALDTRAGTSPVHVDDDDALLSKLLPLQLPYDELLRANLLNEAAKLAAEWSTSLAFRLYQLSFQLVASACLQSVHSRSCIRVIDTLNIRSCLGAIASFADVNKSRIHPQRPHRFSPLLLPRLHVMEWRNACTKMEIYRAVPTLRMPLSD